VTAEPTIGVDLGGTKCLGVVLAPDGTIVAEHRVPTPSGTPAVLDALAGLIAELQRSSAVSASVRLG
jgi:glucokinase